jgi:hypothetical protein
MSDGCRSTKFTRAWRCAMFAALLAGCAGYSACRRKAAAAALTRPPLSTRTPARRR